MERSNSLRTGRAPPNGLITPLHTPRHLVVFWLSGSDSWGPDHTSTLDMFNNLGSLCISQGKIDEAEAMYVRALVGFETLPGIKNQRTQQVQENLEHLRWLRTSADILEWN
ncbi:MAG: hypothetical protein Q9187_001473 [Circinaria calcarea]